MHRQPQTSKPADRAPTPAPGTSRTPAGARPFRIQVADPVLDDLRMRLERTRWTSVSDDDDWALGTRATYLRELVDDWLRGYDWRRHEARLNGVDQFIAPVGGTDLHFLHTRALAPPATPLLLLHGWPDSFDRFHKVMPMLATEFDLVVPSLPGSGFSQPIATRAQPVRHVAGLLRRLMTDVLGYPRFAIAGGDTGGAIAQRLAIDHPDAVIGIHLTDLGWHVGNVAPSTVSKEERDYLALMKKHFLADGAYAMVQTTRPRSLAAGLADSPVGLASWIIDRFHAWSDGDLDARFGRAELLTNIMLYWVTRTIGSSIFTYYAEAESPSLTPADRVARPVAVALFPHDAPAPPPRRFAERTLNVQRWTELPRGGHFAPLDEPTAYAGDVIAFFRSLRDRASH